MPTLLPQLEEVHVTMFLVIVGFLLAMPLVLLAMCVLARAKVAQHVRQGQ